MSLVAPLTRATETPAVIPVDAFISPEYARAEKDRLWAKVWQIACRSEEVVCVGDFVTYDILDDSLVTIRTAPDTIRAYHNVCMHRGHQLVEVYIIEPFPEDGEPKAEWVHEPDPSEENWLRILSQDSLNMPKVQQGMKSRAFPGARPSPVQEQAMIHFHRTLAAYMGVSAPEPLA